MYHRVALRVVETTTVVVVGGGMLLSCGDGAPPPCDGALAYQNPTCGQAAPGGNSDSTSGSSAGDLGDDPPTWEEPSEPPPQAGGATRQEKLADGRTIEITTGDAYSINGVEHRLNGTIRRYAVAFDATGMVILYASGDRSEDNAVFIGNVQFFRDGNCDTDVAWGNEGGQWTPTNCFEA
jgi:hypothetical protein